MGPGHLTRPEGGKNDPNEQGRGQGAGPGHCEVILGGSAAGKKTSRGAVGGAATKHPAPARKKATPVVKKAAPAKKATPAAKKPQAKKAPAATKKAPRPRRPRRHARLPRPRSPPWPRRRPPRRPARPRRRPRPRPGPRRHPPRRPARPRAAPRRPKASTAPAPKATAGAQAKPKPAPPVRPKTGPYAKDTKFLDESADLLREERAIYQGQATDLKAEADSLAHEREPGDVQFDEESGEGGTVTVDRERDLALSAQAAAGGRGDRRRPAPDRRQDLRRLRALPPAHPQAAPAGAALRPPVRRLQERGIVAALTAVACPCRAWRRRPPCLAAVAAAWWWPTR